MQELIRIDRNEQGSEVVSARELFSFLGAKGDFTTWCKRMFEYGFIENQDYTILIKNDEKVSKSNPVDYALTLDTAKEIAMLQRSEKGKQARQYFIECERIAKEKISKPLSPAEQLLANAQLLVDLERKQNEMDGRLKAIEETRNEATKALLEAERSTDEVPEETTRVKIRRIINQYCNAKNADHRSVWHVIYDRLYYRYGVNLRAIVKKKGEATLDVAERLGHLDKIYAICSREFV